MVPERKTFAPGSPKKQTTELYIQKEREREREREIERERENTVKQSDTKKKHIEGVRDIWYIIRFLYFFF